MRRFLKHFPFNRLFVSLFVLLYTFVPSAQAIGVVMEDVSGNIDTSEDILDEGISDPAEIANPNILEEEVIPEVVEEPLFTYEDGVYTVPKVVVNEEYVYPDNANVKVKFTNITEEGNLVISKVLLTQEEKELLNTSDDYGWDIRSSMSNGSFVYDLTLPNTTESKDVEVKYSEDGNTYESIDNNLIVNENVIEIKGLEHFTVFVVAFGVTDGSTCTIGSNTGTCYDTIQEAINAAKLNGDSEWDVINIQNGTYNECLDISGKKIKLIGESRSGVVINNTACTSYGIHVHEADQIIFKNMTVMGASSSYTFKIAGSTNIELRKILVKDSKRTAIDLNGVNGAILNNIVAQNTTEGFGLMIKDSNDIKVGTVTTANNAWGGVSVQTEGISYAGGVNNVSFSEDFNASEIVSLLLEKDPSAYPDITNVTIPTKFSHIVYTLRSDGNKQWFYQESLENAKLFANGLVGLTTPYTYSDILIYDILEEKYWVIPGMSIQEAIDAATSGDIINVAEGTYQEQVIINESLTLQGIDNPTIKAPASPATLTFPESPNNWEPVVFAFGGTADTGHNITGTGTIQVTITGFIVDGNDRVPNQRSAGILLRNANGTISRNTVQNMHIDGKETFGIQVYGDSDITITENNVSGYARGGIGASGDSNGTNPSVYPTPRAVITNNTITGPGMGVPVTWAPNGIQIGWGATGEITSNTVSGNGWPGTDWTGSGILVAMSDNVEIDNNIVEDNETGIAVAGYMWDSNGLTATGTLIHNNTVDGNTYGISIQDKSVNTTIEKNTITNSTYDGIDICNFYGNPPTGTVIKSNTITGNNTAEDEDSGGIWIDNGVDGNEVSINLNNITSNNQSGILNTSIVNIVDATKNWWGDATGPKDTVSGDNSVLDTNPGGIGSAVIGAVKYSPWYKNESMTALSSDLPSTPTGLTAKFQYDSQYLLNGSTINKTAKPNGNNLELLWQPNPIDLVTGYRILGTFPDGTTKLSYQGPNTNAWLKKYNGFGAYGNGKYSYQVIAKNVNGISDPSEPFVIYYDTHSPTAKLTSAPADNSYVSGDFNVTGIADDNVALRSVFFDVRTQNGGTWKSGCKSGTTVLTYSDDHKHADISCTIDTRNLVNGTTYMLRIHAGDNAGYGNVNSEAIRYFTMDTVEPTVSFEGLRHYDYRYPSVPVDTTNINTSDNTPIVLISASDSLSGMKSVTVNEQTAVYDGSTYWIVELAALGDGTNTLEIVGTDNAGNTETVSRDIFIDTNPPTAIYTHYNNGIVVDETANPITYVKRIDQLSFTAQYTDTTPSSGLYQDSFVIFEAQDDGSFKFSTDGKKAFCTWRKSPNLINIPSSSTYNLTEKISFTKCVDSLQDGEYYMTHQVYDNATRWNIPIINQYRDVLGLHFVVDKTKPTVEITNVNITDKNLSFTVSGTDNLSGARTVGINIYNENNTGSPVIAIGRLAHDITPGTLNVNYDSPVIDISELESGTYTIRASIRDYASNIKYATYYIEVDNTSPTTPTATLTANGIPVLTNGYTSSETFTFNLSSSEDTNRYQLKYWNNIPGSPFKENSPWSPTNIAGYMNPFGSYNDKFTQGEGKHYFSFSACDAAGNCSAFTDPYSVTYDKTPPTGSIDSIYYPLKDMYVSHFITNDNTPIIYGTAYDNNGTYSTTVKIGTYDSTSGGGGGGFWSVGGFPNIPDGTYPIVLTITDLAGNETTVEREITIDTMAPTALHRYFKNGVEITDSIAYVKGTSELTFLAEYFDEGSGIYQDSYVIFDSNDDGTARTSKAYCGWRNSENTLSITENPLTAPVPFTNCSTTLLDGEYFMYHQVYDNATRQDKPEINQFRDYKGLHFIVDSLVPTSIITTPSSGYITNEEPEIIGYTEDIYSVDKVVLSYTNYDTATSQCGTEWIELTTIDNPDKETDIDPFDWSYNEWNLEDGIYCIKAQATDLAGNEEQTAVVENVTYDTTPPEKVIITADQMLGILKDVTASDSLSGVQKIEISADNIKWVEYILGTDVDLNDLVGNQPGTHTIYIRVTDNAGNTKTETVIFTIPSPAPTTTETGEDVLGLATEDKDESSSKLTPVQALGTGGYLPLSQTDLLDTEEQQTPEEETITEDTTAVKGEEDNNKEPIKEDVTPEENTTKWWIYPLVILPLLAIFLILWKRRKEDNQPQL